MGLWWNSPSVVWLSVFNVRAPYLAGWNFRQFFYAVWFLGHPLTSAEYFTKIVPGILSVKGVKRKRGNPKYSDFELLEAIYQKRCKIWGTLVLITNRKSYMSFRLYQNRWPWMAKWPIFCVILPNLVVSGAHCVKLVDKAITMDTLRLLCLVVKVCGGTARLPWYKYSITARWKLCSRFINSRLNEQYLLSYRIIC